MNVGMLWFDDSNRKLEEKVARAVEHYQEKYGQSPTLCFVHPGTLDGGSSASPSTSLRAEPRTGANGAAGVQIRAMRSVLPHHFWIGVGEPVAGTYGNGHNGSRAAGRVGKSARRAKA